MSSESDDPKKPPEGSDALPELPAEAEPGLAPVAKVELPPGASGSVDVQLSNPELGAIPEKASPADSQPVSASGAVVAAIPNEGTGPARRSRRVTGLVQDAVSAGVEKLGAGIETVGEGVTKVGDLTKKVPLVGAGVGRLGEGLTKAGESIHALPRVAQTRRGRLLVRSVVVGFLLVFSWITVIVGFQLREHDTPDFRPAAEQILLQINKGKDAIGDVYDHSSPRFQELVGREKFIDNMMDLYATNGRFREITAVNETLVTTGPTGQVGRVSLTAAYEKGIAHASISFHYHKGQWKLLGNYKRLLTVTEARKIVSSKPGGAATATFDTVAEFERSNGVRVVADFARGSTAEKWQLRRFKVEVPMPRAEDGPSLVPPPPQMPPAPAEAPSDASTR